MSFGNATKKDPPPIPPVQDAEAEAKKQAEKLRRRSGFLGSVLNRSRQTGPAGSPVQNTVG